MSRHTARLVGVGIARPDWVDKHRTWGSVPRLTEELAGIPPSWSCDVCDTNLDAPHRARHQLTKRHLRLVAEGLTDV